METRDSLGGIPTFPSPGLSEGASLVNQGDLDTQVHLNAESIVQMPNENAIINLRSRNPALPGGFAQGRNTELTFCRGHRTSPLDRLQSQKAAKGAALRENQVTKGQGKCQRDTGREQTLFKPFKTPQN